MEDELLPQSIGEIELPPVSLLPEQEELCRRLDDLHNQYGLKALPSNMFRGAVFAARTECRRGNPDWLSLSEKFFTPCGVIRLRAFLKKRVPRSRDMVLFLLTNR